MTLIINSVPQWRSIRNKIDASTPIGFVPTMGALHEGHISLLHRAKSENALSVLSIFVNPAQFNDKEDFAKYPKPLSADIKIANECKVDYLLLPIDTEIYCDHYSYVISEKNQSTLLEGRSRPEHFDGVLTIVMKLFSLVKPNRAYFGEKDFQQLVLIQGLVKAFFLDIDIIPCPTVRESSGLALSSRNQHLTALQREKASLIYQLLSTYTDPLIIAQKLEQAGFSIDYIEKWCDRLLAAVKLDNIRLIDNIPFNHQPS
ncbi:MAG: pantoate--beta-alanine ligase [Candidatus Berkiellales bacterium]